MLREAEIDWKEVKRLMSDRKAWKERVAERMEHLDWWKRKKGQSTRGEQVAERLERNVERGEEELRCRYDGCMKKEAQGE